MGENHWTHQQQSSQLAHQHLYVQHDGTHLEHGRHGHIQPPLLHVHHHHQQHQILHNQHIQQNDESIKNANVIAEQIASANYDTGSGKSTKGASKLRRDMINSEVSVLRDLLPLPPSTRQRLSQLQLMALVCVYVRKSNYFERVFKILGLDFPPMETVSFGFSKALNGFLMMTTQSGKLLYISDNAAEYLGHSMEDLLIHGDSVYDIIDKQDHSSIQNELMRGHPLNSLGQTDSNLTSSHQSNSSVITSCPRDTDSGMHQKRLFLCRMNVSRNARRQMRFGDQKVVLIEGHFSGTLPLCSKDEPVFVSWCTPIAMPETRECVVQGATNIFTSIHSLDFKIKSIDRNGEFYLGYASSDLVGVSWYNLVHPDSMKEVQAKHKLITQSENEKSCILLIRLQRQDGNWIWVHVVLQLKDTGYMMSDGVHNTPIIVCTNQYLNESEAWVMRNNIWLYHYYLVQSRIQYSLAYGGGSESQSSNATTATPTTNFYHHQVSSSTPTSYSDGSYGMITGDAHTGSESQTHDASGTYSYNPPPSAYNSLQSEGSIIGNGHLGSGAEYPIDFSSQTSSSASSISSPSSIYHHTETPTCSLIPWGALSHEILSTADEMTEMIKMEPTNQLFSHSNELTSTEYAPVTEISMAAGQYQALPRRRSRIKAGHHTIEHISGSFVGYSGSNVSLHQREEVPALYQLKTWSEVVNRKSMKQTNKLSSNKKEKKEISPPSTPSPAYDSNNNNASGAIYYPNVVSSPENRRSPTTSQSSETSCRVVKRM